MVKPLPFVKMPITFAATEKKHYSTKGFEDNITYNQCNKKSQLADKQFGLSPWNSGYLHNALSLW